MEQNIVSPLKCEECGAKLNVHGGRTCQICKRLLCSRHFPLISKLSMDAGVCKSCVVGAKLG
jgi:hypothetical protein